MMKKVLLMFLSTICLLGCQQKMGEDRDTQKDMSVEILSQDSVIKENYYISKTAFHDNKIILKYNSLLDNPKYPTIIKIYDENTLENISTIQMDKNYNSEIICNKSGFYIYNSKSIEIYDYNGKKMNQIDMKDLDSQKPFNIPFCISQDLETIAYCVQDENDESGEGYIILTSDLSFNNKKEQFKFKQKKPKELQLILQMYFSNSNQRIGFMGITFPTQDDDVESVQCYGTIDFSTKKVDLHIQNEINSLYTNNTMYILDTMRDSYTKPSSGYVRYMNLSDGRLTEVEVKNPKSSEQTFLLADDMFACLNFDKSLSSKGYALDVYEDNKYVKTISYSQLKLPDDPQSLQFIYLKQKNQILMTYYYYQNEEYKMNAQTLSI